MYYKNEAIQMGINEPKKRVLCHYIVTELYPVSCFILPEREARKGFKKGSQKAIKKEL